MFPPQHPSGFDDPLRPRNPPVARRWLVSAIGVMLLAALAAVYFALGLLFWQGQWQLIFHPGHRSTETPATTGTAFEEVRFDATATGQPRLTGWWIPENPGLPHRAAAILYLHSERGSLSDTLPDIDALHALGYDLFAFDPRGYGKSDWAMPSEKHWNEDAEAALSYLESVRHIPPESILLVGRGLGGTVAANLTKTHPELRSLVMVDPEPPTLAKIQGPRWTHILPVRLLARDRFDPTTALASPTLHKLFLVNDATNLPNYLRYTPDSEIVSSTTLGDALTAPALHQFFEQSPAER